MAGQTTVALCGFDIRDMTDIENVLSQHYRVLCCDRAEDLGQLVLEAFRHQGRQQLLHCFNFRPEQTGEPGAAGQMLQRWAGIGPQRREQGP